MGSKRLYRTEGPYKMLAGVCGGIAEYFDIDLVKFQSFTTSMLSTDDE